MSKEPSEAKKSCPSLTLGVRK